VVLIDLSQDELMYWLEENTEIWDICCHLKFLSYMEGKSTRVRMAQNCILGDILEASGATWEFQLGSPLHWAEMGRS
jgi:hypothetical protein